MMVIEIGRIEKDLVVVVMLLFIFDAISDAIKLYMHALALARANIHTRSTHADIFNAPDSSNVQSAIAMLCRCLLFPYTKYYSNRFLYPVHLISS